jgi:outer membrane protein assembly factor BamE
MSRKNNHLMLLSLVVLLSAGCRSVPMLPGITAYKIDIQQGNVITRDMLDKLQPGMTRSQVRFVLGTPLLVDPFRTDRWDYIYIMNRKGALVEQRQLKVYFQEDKMLRYEGDTVVDTQIAQPLPLQPETKPMEKPAADKPAETRGFFARLFGWGAKPSQPATVQGPQSAPAPATAK